MSDAWPTFDRCPHCHALLWTDVETDGAWCIECDYEDVQADLFQQTDPD